MLLKLSRIFYLNSKLGNGARTIDEQNNLFDIFCFSCIARSSHAAHYWRRKNLCMIFMLEKMQIQRTFVRLSNKDLYDFKVFLYTTLTYATLIILTSLLSVMFRSYLKCTRRSNLKQEVYLFILYSYILTTPTYGRYTMW